MPTSPAPVALVTGAARRIGRAVALRLARDGHDVAVHFHRSRAEAAQVVAEVAALARRAEAFAADLTQPDEVLRLAAEVEARLGPVDVVVHNASIFRATAVLATPPGDLWRDADEFHAVHVRAPLLLVRALAPAMLRGRGGVFVHIADASAPDSPRAGHAPYEASKAALLSLSRALAKELPPVVRVHAVLPGSILPPSHGGGGPASAFPRATVDDVADAVARLVREPGTGRVVRVPPQSP